MKGTCNICGRESEHLTRRGFCNKCLINEVTKSKNISEVLGTCSDDTCKACGCGCQH